MAGCVRAQKNAVERGERRKKAVPADCFLGHAVKNRMTVIEDDGELSGEVDLWILWGCLSTVPFFLRWQWAMQKHTVAKQRDKLKF